MKTIRIIAFLILPYTLAIFGTLYIKNSLAASVISIISASILTYITPLYQINLLSNRSTSFLGNAMSLYAILCALHLSIMAKSGEIHAQLIIFATLWLNTVHEMSLIIHNKAKRFNVNENRAIKGMGIAQAFLVFFLFVEAAVRNLFYGHVITAAVHVFVTLCITTLLCLITHKRATGYGMLTNICRISFLNYLIIIAIGIFLYLNDNITSDKAQSYTYIPFLLIFVLDICKRIIIYQTKKAKLKNNM